MPRWAKFLFGLLLTLIGSLWIDLLGTRWASAIRASNREYVTEKVTSATVWCLPGVIAVALGVILLLRAVRRR